MMIKQAVSVVIPFQLSGTTREQQRGVVSVSRRGDNTKWGLPGGKVDPDETNLDAIVRETFEEIGVRLNPALLIPIYSGICVGDVTYWVTTYLYRSMNINAADLVPEPGLEVSVLPIDLLADPNKSPFAVYNANVISSLQQISKMRQ